MNAKRTKAIAAITLLLTLLLALPGAAPLAAQAALTLPEDTLTAYRGTPTPASEAIVPAPRRAAVAAPTLPQDTVAGYEAGAFRMPADAGTGVEANAAAAGAPSPAAAQSPAAQPARDYTLRVRVDTLRVVDGVAEVTVRYDTLHTAAPRQRPARKYPVKTGEW
jgi:hypothetical protein